MPLRRELVGELGGGRSPIVEWIAMTVPGLACTGQLADHLAHLLVVADHHADDVRVGDLGDAVRQRGAGLGRTAPRLGRTSYTDEPARPATQPLAIGLPMLPSPTNPTGRRS